jgi:hypothetical protein
VLMEREGLWWRIRRVKGTQRKVSWLCICAKVKLRIVPLGQDTHHDADSSDDHWRRYRLRAPRPWERNDLVVAAPFFFFRALFRDCASLALLVATAPRGSPARRR